MELKSKRISSKLSSLNHHKSKKDFDKKRYYIKLWKQARTHEPSHKRLITFRRYVKQISSISKPSSLILDIGCASGTFSRMLGSIGNKNLIGIDLVNRFSRGHNISFIVAESTHLPFQRKSFDIIFARKFVSMKDTKESLLEFYEILKDNGKIVIEVPNVKRLKSRIYEVLGMIPLYNVKYFPHFHLDLFKKILCQSNFIILRIEGDNIVIPLLNNLNFLFRHQKIQRFIGQLFPSLCEHIFAICKKMIQPDLKFRTSK